MATCRLLIAGPTNVGKSAFILQCCNGVFVDYHYDPTISDSYRKVYNLDNGHTMIVDFLDVSTQTEYQAMKEQLYRHCDAAIIMYSITDNDSFLEVPNIFEEIKTTRNDSDHDFPIPLLIFGNKNDLNDQRKVSEVYAIELGRHLNTEVIEGSSKQKDFVNETVKRVATLALIAQREQAYRAAENERPHRRPKIRRCTIV